MYVYTRLRSLTEHISGPSHSCQPGYAPGGFLLTERVFYLYDRFYPSLSLYDDRVSQADSPINATVTLNFPQREVTFCHRSWLMKP